MSSKKRVGTSRWDSYFQDFHDPYLHLTPEQYATLSERNGFRVLYLSMKDQTWDFGSRTAFFSFCAVGCVAWADRLRATERSDFINDVLDRYRAVAAHGRGVQANSSSALLSRAVPGRCQANRDPME
jgi:trans-aconitate 2-methyltransferase